MLGAFRWFAALGAEDLLRLAMLTIAALVVGLLFLAGLAAFLWHGLVLARATATALKEANRERMNLQAVETFARQDERRRVRTMMGPGPRHSLPPQRAPDSLRDPLPAPPSRELPEQARHPVTPVPDTMRSEAVKEWSETVASTPRPPPLPDSPESSEPQERAHSIQWKDLERVSAKPSQLDWRDSRLKTTQLPQMYPLVEKEKRRLEAEERDRQRETMLPPAPAERSPRKPPR